MLIDVTTGVPLFEPTAWSMTMYRAKSAATMEQALQGGMLLHLFCERRGIDLAQRVSGGIFLTTYELDALATDIALPAEVLLRSAPRPVYDAACAAGGLIGAVPSTVRLLRALPSAKRVKAVDQNTQTIRFQPKYAAYLNLIEPWWKILRVLALKGRRFDAWAEIEEAVRRATEYWNAHKHPFVWGRRRRHRTPRRLGIAAAPNVTLI